MLSHVENDFFAKTLNLKLIEESVVLPLAFDEPNRAAYEIADSFNAGALAGHNVNICANNNASVYWNREGGFALLIRNGAGFDVAATFDSCGDSESDLDCAYRALAIRNT